MSDDAEAQTQVDLLIEAGRRLAEVTNGDSVRDEVSALVERLEDRRFLVAVVGEFKRGKSTLINALLGESVVPTGVLPLTAIATEIGYGAPGVRVDHLDGREQNVALSDLTRFVTEAENPSNELGVERVDVRGGWPLLQSGVVLVDTPGVGSVHTHNTAVAQRALVDADGAIMVMSADAPISDAERNMLEMLVHRHAPTFFVLNKIDHLTTGEQYQVRTFVEGVIREQTGRASPLFAVSARAALTAAEGGDAAGPDAGEWNAFVAELASFIDRDLVAAHLATGRRKLGALADRVRTTISVEIAAARLDATELMARVAEFQVEAAAQRVMFDDDRTLLERDVARVGEQLWDELRAFATTAPDEHRAELEHIAAGATRADLHVELRLAIEQAVHTSFGEFRQHQSEVVENAWQQLAATFQHRTEERIGQVRAAASSLFDVPLPNVVVPAMTAEPQRFFFRFEDLDHMEAPMRRALVRFVPAHIARRRAVAHAQRWLRAEFSKHAGAARADLVYRLNTARGRFEHQMSIELESSIEAILEAATRAEHLHDETRSGREEYIAAAEQRLARVAAASDVFGDR